MAPTSLAGQLVPARSFDICLRRRAQQPAGSHKLEQRLKDGVGSKDCQLHSGVSNWQSGPRSSARQSIGSSRSRCTGGTSDGVPFENTQSIEGLEADRKQQRFYSLMEPCSFSEAIPRHALDESQMEKDWYLDKHIVIRGQWLPPFKVATDDFVYSHSAGGVRYFKYKEGRESYIGLRDVLEQV